MRFKYLAIVAVSATIQLSVASHVHASDDEVLVKNAWTVVTKADYTLELGRLPEQYRGGISVSGKRVVELIDKILTRKTLAAQARELKMDAEEETQLRIRWLIDETLSQLRIERLEQSAMRDFESRMEFFEQRAGELFAASKSSGEFKTPFKVNASHILVDLEGRTSEEARARIEKIREDTLSGSSFEDLALEYSDDPTVKQNKGSLGSFGLGQMVKSFEDAVLKLEKIGDVSPVVETSYGLHIIKLHSRSGGQPLTFEQAKPAILLKLKSDFVSRVRIKHMKEIDSDESMTIDEQAIDSLVVPVAIPDAI